MEKLLHSRFNPAGEAERYLNSLGLDRPYRYIILLEPGEGYLVAPLRRLQPQAKIIALHVEKQRETGERPAAAWDPSCGKGLREFLEGEIPDTEAERIKVIPWRPAQERYGAAYLKLLSETTDFIKRIDANSCTVKGFGRRWFRNFFKNLRLLNNIYLPSPLSLPVFAAAAGPSLEDALPLLAGKREAFFVLGVSSAGPALGARGITPDLLLASDGGNWALLHLYEDLRRFRGKVPLAACLSAALPSQAAEIPVLPICDGSLWQRLVLERLRLPFISLPQRGTVSAQALDLALRLSGGKVFFTGLDLANRDLQSHARPYPFDRLEEEAALRLSPLYGRVFSRSRSLAQEGSAEVYAAWFREEMKTWPQRIRSLGGNHPVFSSIAVREDDLAGAVTLTPAPTDKGRQIKLDSGGHPARKAARFQAARFLVEALRQSPGAPALREELVPLLFPGREAGEMSLRELEEEILRLGR